jgi:hypothetical protein
VMLPVKVVVSMEISINVQRTVLRHIQVNTEGGNRTLLHQLS